MNRNYILENNLIEQYLNHHLSPEEAEDFEVYCLDHPEMAEELALAKCLKDELPAALAEQEVSQATPPLQWFQAPGWALAATVMVAVGIISSAFLAVQLVHTNQQLETFLTPGRIVAEISLEQMRGDSSTEAFLPDTKGAVLIHVDLGPNPTPPYGVRISKAGEVIWTESQLVPSSIPTELTLIIPQPAPGSYEVDVTSKDLRSPLRYSFTLNEPD